MGTLLMPVLYYSYTSALGHSILAVDITIFYICVIAAFLIYRGLSGSCLLEKYSHVTSMAVFLLLICLDVYKRQLPFLGFKSPLEENIASTNVPEFAEVMKNVHNSMRDTTHRIIPRGYLPITMNSPVSGSVSYTHLDVYKRQHPQWHRRASALPHPGLQQHRPVQSQPWPVP